MQKYSIIFIKARERVFYFSFHYNKFLNDEIEDFIIIQESLEKISITVETLQLWVEKMLATGKIDNELYQKHLKSREI